MICHYYGESYCFCYYYYCKSSPPNFDPIGKNEIHQYEWLLVKGQGHRWPQIYEFKIAVSPLIVINEFPSWSCLNCQGHFRWPLVKGLHYGMVNHFYLFPWYRIESSYYYYYNSPSLWWIILFLLKLLLIWWFAITMVNHIVFVIIIIANLRHQILILPGKMKYTNMNDLWSKVKVTGDLKFTNFK